jgi:nitrite reductase/ring-hydroxylating ferredoxin subunit
VDPDLYGFGAHGSGSFHQQAKKVRRTLICTLKKSNFLLASGQPLTKKQNPDPEPDP